MGVFLWARYPCTANPFFCCCLIYLQPEIDRCKSSSCSAFLARLCCGSRLRKGEVFAYVGRNLNLEDLKDRSEVAASREPHPHPIGPHPTPETRGPKSKNDNRMQVTAALDMLARANRALASAKGLASLRPEDSPPRKGKGE